MAVFNNILAGASGQSKEPRYSIDRSLRFNAADSAYLSRTPSTAGNRKTWTWSGWVKLSSTTPYAHLFTMTNGVIARFGNSSGKMCLHFSSFTGGGFNWVIESSADYRDLSAWYHVVFTLDTTDPTPSSRVKAFVNGQQVTDLATSSYPNQNTDWSVNNTVAHQTGRYDTSFYGTFYLADVHFIDGQALDPSSFGEYDSSNVWQPKEYTGTYGTNGFHLDFSNNSSAAALVEDSSGNGNDWTAVNLTSSIDFLPAVEFDGTGDYLDLADNAVLTPSGDFTIEFFAYVSNSSFIREWYSKGYGIQIYTSSGNWGLALSSTNSGPYYIYNNSICATLNNTWEHIAVTRSGNTYSFFQNGILQYTVSSSNSPNTGTNVLRLGDWSGATGYGIVGFMSNVRYVDGTALYTSNFTVPTTPLSAVTNTVLLCCQSSTNATAATVTPGPITANGNASATLKSDTSPNNDSFVDSPTNGTQTDGITPVLYNPVYYGTASAGAATDVFDGDLATRLSVRPNGSGVSFDSVTVNTSLRVYGSAGSGNLYLNKTLNTTLNTGGIPSAQQWLDCTSSISFPYTLTDVGWHGGSGGDNSKLFAIEVDGEILIENNRSGSFGGVLSSNYCTLNPLTCGSAYTLSNGNLEISDTGTSQPVALGTIAVNSGKWYWEVTLGNSYSYVGAAKVTSRTSVPYLGGASGQFCYNPYQAVSSQINGSNYTYGSLATTGDVIGVALDFDSNAITFYKNGVSMGAFGSNVLGTDTWAPAFKSNLSSSATFNFGQRPFVYTAPIGYKALCTANLPMQTIGEGSDYFEAVAYTGDGQNPRSITGLNFSPDVVWIKSRGTSKNNWLHDTIRGTSLYVVPNEAWVEGSNTWLTSFDSNGFTVTGDGRVNANAVPFVAWTWDAGSSTVTNTDGTITSQVKANPSAGFSIVSYTGTGANATIGHGLNAAPEMIMVKNRDSALHWNVYHVGIDASSPENYFLRLNTNNYRQSASVKWNDTAPTSSVFTVGTSGNVNGNTQDLIAYCFASVEGYSAFGSYTGNNSADGPFVFTGFSPRWLMIKNAISSSGNWVIYDTARDSTNLNTKKLAANMDAKENVSGLGDNTIGIDVLSNGFKVRTTGANHNNSGSTYIYAAFAEHPFRTARAR